MATTTGIKTVTAGALKVAVEKGIITIIPKGTPAGVIANLACISIENVKILITVHRTLYFVHFTK